MVPTLHCPLGSVLGCGVKITVYSLNSQESCRLQIPNFSSLFLPCSKWQLCTTGEQTGPSSFDFFLCPRESLFFSTKKSQVAVRFPRFFQTTSVISALHSWSGLVSHIRSEMKETPKQIQYRLCPAACGVGLGCA